MPSAIAPASATSATDPQHAVADARPERPAPQLVQRVRGDAHAQEEPGERQDQVVAGEDDRGHGAERHVRQVPRRVRRVQQRPPVAPAAGRQRVERRALGVSPRSSSAISCPRPRRPSRSSSAAHARRRCRPRATAPAARRAAAARRTSRMFGPRKRPTSPHAGDAARPIAGQGPPRVRGPHEPPHGVGRDEELEVRERAAGTQHACQLGERRRRIVHVAQQVGERDARRRCRRGTAGVRRVRGRTGPSRPGRVPGRGERRVRDHLLALVQPHDRRPVRRRGPPRRRPCPSPRPGRGRRPARAPARP